jgi:hypothetical protein
MSAALSRFWSLWRRRRCSSFSFLPLSFSDGMLCNYCSCFSTALKFALKRHCHSVTDWTFCPHQRGMIASYCLKADIYVSSCYYQLYLL